MSKIGDKAVAGRTLAVVTDAPRVLHTELSDVNHPVNTDSGKVLGGYVLGVMPNGNISIAIAQGGEPEASWTMQLDGTSIDPA